MMEVEFDDKLFVPEELLNTPERIRKFQREWESNRKFHFTTFDNPGYHDMIILKDIDFASLCAHHLLPFMGRCHIGYIPNGNICGISKLARTVDMFASKPQLQEKMTSEIADFLLLKLDPKGVMVVVEGQHDCMRIRGVRKASSIMVTSAIRGVFERPEVRQEFMGVIGHGK
jgi:GTP cyclohydrolase I